MHTHTHAYVHACTHGTCVHTCTCTCPHSMHEYAEVCTDHPCFYANAQTYTYTCNQACMNAGTHTITFEPFTGFC